MPLTVTVNTIAECLQTDCNILGDLKKGGGGGYTAIIYTAHAYLITLFGTANKSEH
jgi:hypothetical protein